MVDLLAYFDPQPRASELPSTLPSPFRAQPPHAIARRAAAQLEAQLHRGELIATGLFEGVRRGKMFGVLVVVDGAGQVGYLRGFSGMVEGSWQVPGFVGPLFDPGLRDAVWPAGKSELAALDRRLAQLASTGPMAAAASAALAHLEARHEAAVAALAEVHELRRQQRRDQRERDARSALSPAQRRRALDGLAGQSRADTLAQRQQRKDHRAEREPLSRVLSALEQQHALVRQRQVALSGQLLEQLFAGYQIDSARGPRRSLRDLFAPAAPPGGAGDCAAPKLFGHALREGLRPLALAEFWVGTPASAAGRQRGVYHPSCQRKCGPVLTHMLDGLALDA